MTKRLSRYNTPESIQSNLPHLIDKKINIILEDGRVYYGVLVKTEKNGIILSNMRLKKKQISFEEIAEIIFDHY